MRIIEILHSSLFFRNFDLRSNLLSLDNKNKNRFILYCARLIVTLQPRLLA